MKEKISPIQYYSIIFVYLISNDIVRGIYAQDLKNDFWIPNVVGTLFSMLLFTLYIFIYKNNNYDGFTNSFKHTLGKFIFRILSIFYIVYFLTISFFTVVDVVEMVSIHLLPNYPTASLSFVCLISVGYLLFKKVEVVGRLSELLMIVIYVTFFAMIFFTISLYEFKLSNILPILQGDYKIILRTSLEMGYAMPFGELFVFMIIYEHLNKKEKVTKVTNLAILTSGLAMTTVTLFNLFILGPDPMAIGISPAVRLARTIDIEEYIQRLDLLLVAFNVILLFVKTFILLYGAGRLLKDMFNFDEKKEKISYLCFLIIIFFISTFIYKGYTQILVFRKNFFIPYVNIIFEVFIPLLIIIISFMRKGKRKYHPDEILEYTI